MSLQFVRVILPNELVQPVGLGFIDHLAPCRDSESCSRYWTPLSGDFCLYRLK
jgi:hypothetical protein